MVQVREKYGLERVTQTLEVIQGDVDRRKRRGHWENHTGSITGTRLRTDWNGEVGNIKGKITLKIIK